MRRFTTDEFVSKAKEIHGSTYDYSKVVYFSMHKDVEIVCHIHGSFLQQPSNHLKGAGCSLCTKSLNRRLKQDDVLRRFRSIHGDKYDYSLVDYCGTAMPVEIICSIHGSFWQRPNKHLSGSGCPLCAPNHADNKESFIEKARKVHGDLYDYSKVNYINSQTKVCIVDRLYGEFWQKPYSHLNGRGHWLRRAEKINKTKHKNNTFHVSEPENKAYKFLCEKFGENHVYRQYSSYDYPFSCDFYVDTYDLYIEMNLYVSHGFHWFNENDDADLERLNKLKSKAEGNNLYSKMIYTWTDLDLRKRKTVEDNDLNYLVFWNNDLSDFFEWYESFDDKHILKSY